jgi:hypothetical protein
MTQKEKLIRDIENTQALASRGLLGSQGDATSQNSSQKRIASTSKSSWAHMALS